MLTDTDDILAPEYKATKHLTLSLLEVLILDTENRQYELNRLKNQSDIYSNQERLD